MGVFAEDVCELDCAVAVVERLDEPCLIVELLLDGDASRESVLRKLPFFLGGGEGRLEVSSGSLGSLKPGRDSRSFASTSTISTPVRVSVKLWVGA